MNINRVTLSGLMSNLYCSVDGDKANFTLYINEATHTTKIHVNLFGKLVEMCKNMNLKSGDVVLVDGELMNRTKKSSQNIVLEVKAHDIRKNC